ncbi:MAG TPA: PaaI family thioesterase [Acidimicrobiales bacterium]|nr:PaaI family thioesterase [Acidimicrobiales bacterium]
MSRPEPPGAGAVRAAIEDPTGYLRAAMPMCATLGFVADRVDTESVEVSVVWSEGLCTANGVIHGGVVMALADAAGALLAYLNLPEGAAGTTTIESKTNFLGAARNGTLTATARILHAGRTTIVVETDLATADNPVAKTTQTQLVLLPR